MQLKYLLPRTERKQSIYAPPNEEEIKAITDLWVNGEPVKNIAATLGVGWQRVRKTLITVGIWENDTSRKINELYRKGLSIAEISAKTGIEKAVVHNYLPYREPQGYSVPINQLSLTFDSFLEWAANNEKSEETILSYKIAYSRYAQRFDRINKDTMLAFKRYTLDNYQHSTASGMLSGMNMFCRFLGHQEWCVKVPRTKRIESVENIISLQQYNQLVNGLREDGNEKWYHIVSWLAHTGARPNDILILTKTCLEKGYQDIISKGMSRRLYIAPCLINESQEYFRGIDHELLFPNLYGHKMTVKGLNAQLKRFGKRYGIPDNVMHPYAFRHFFAKQFLANNKNIHLLSDVMGHWNLNTTRIYTRQTLKEQLTELDETVQNW